MLSEGDGLRGELDRNKLKGIRRILGSAIVLAGLAGLVGVFGLQSAVGAGSSDVSEQTAPTERSRVTVYEGSIPGTKPGDGKFARMTIARKKRKVNVYLLAFCGEYGTGYFKIRNRKFSRFIKYGTGHRIRVSGKVSKNGRRITGKIRVWYPKGNCDSGTRKYVAKIW